MGGQISARVVGLPEDWPARDGGSQVALSSPTASVFFFFLRSYFGDVYRRLFSCQARLPSGRIVTLFLSGCLFSLLVSVLAASV